jgi:K+-sensing histidine kinase KdpD
VPAHLQPRLFQQPVPGEDGAGGLGLMITRFLIERMGGTIRIDAPYTPNHPALQPCGAVFSITLPQAHRESIDAAIGRPAPRQGEPVDDDDPSAAQPNRSATDLDRRR